MAVGDLYQTTISFTYQRNPNVYLYTFRLDAIVPPQEPEDELNTFFQVTVIPALQPLHAPGVSFECVDTQLFYPTKGVREQLALAPPLAGSRTGEGLPGQCSVVTQLLTDPDDNTPRNRGRDFNTGASKQIKRMVGGFRLTWMPLRPSIQIT